MSCVLLRAVLALVLCAAFASAACNITAVIEFADAQFNCAVPSCSSRVCTGCYQEQYQCAEFAARASVYGGCIPGISPWASQNDYVNYQYAGRSYNLCWVASCEGGGLGLGDYLAAAGWRNVGTNPASVAAGCIISGNAGGGSCSHAGIVDAHNYAAYRKSAASMFFNGINQIYCPTNAPRQCHTTDALNLRNGPGTSYAALLVIPAGSPVTDLKQALVPANGYQWRKISFKGTAGWAVNEWLADC